MKNSKKNLNSKSFGSFAIIFRLINRLAFILVIVSCLACQSSGTSSNSSLQNTVVQVHAASDNHLLGRFRVELADEPTERAMGLMYRQELASDAGMLFIFDAPTTSTFWMRNTSIPLDIIFIGEDQRILTIGEGVPFSETPVGASAPFLYVLEINRGRATELGISVGDRVEFSLP